MKGWLAVGVMLGATVAALAAPWPAVAAMAAAAWLLMPKRVAFAAFAATTLAINAVLLAWLHPAPADARLIVELSRTGFEAGLVAGLRIVALLGANLAIVGRYQPARLLEDLSLPRRALAGVAAVVVAAHDIGRDATRLLDAQRSDAPGPPSPPRASGAARAASAPSARAGPGRLERVRRAASFVPSLLVVAVQRARHRQDALRLAGVDTGSRFAATVAVTALAVAGRLALVAVPNVSLTFVIVFAGGVAFGARVGFFAGLWSMLLTDLLISGLFLPAFVNVPTTALLGALGGAFHSVPVAASNGGRAPVALAAAAVGVLATLAWSIATDTLSWALIAENRASIDRLRFAITAGLVFNAVPAIINGALFAAVVGPVAAAFREDARPRA